MPTRDDIDAARADAALDPEDRRRAVAERRRTLRRRGARDAMRDAVRAADPAQADALEALRAANPQAYRKALAAAATALDAVPALPFGERARVPPGTDEG